MQLYLYAANQTAIKRVKLIIYIKKYNVIWKKYFLLNKNSL